MKRLALILGVLFSLTLSASSQFAIFQVNGTPPIDLSQYTLTFQDNFATFSGTLTCPKGGSTWYLHKPDGQDFGNVGFNVFSVPTPGTLNITLNNPGSGWQGGIMSSIDCAGNGFKQAPWTYYEVEANFPTGGGSTWPAVWSLLACHIPFPGTCDDGEIDSPEWFGNFMRTQLQLAFHHWISPTPEVTQYSAVLPSDPSGVFHKYGTDIGPDYIVYYYDRLPIFRIATPSWAITNWYFLIDLACSGAPPCGDPATVNPSVMQLHYVHVYQHN